jgi:hypothetical protein
VLQKYDPAVVLGLNVESQANFQSSSKSINGMVEC